MRGMRALYTATAILLTCVLAIGAIGTASQSGTSAAVGAAAACTWLDPQPERIAITIEQLTEEPVDDAHWDRWAGDTEGLTTSESAGVLHQVRVVVVTGCWPLRAA